jgi:ribosomal protein L19
MPAINKSVVSLRIVGDALIAEKITAQLGAEPTLCYRKGDIRLTRQGQEVVRPTGMWSIDVKDQSPEDLNSQITEVLGYLIHALNIWRTLASKYRIDFFCGLFMEGSNEGVSISSATLASVGERGIEIGLDIYAPDKQSAAKRQRLEQLIAGTGDRETGTRVKVPEKTPARIGLKKFCARLSICSLVERLLDRGNNVRSKLTL